MSPIRKAIATRAGMAPRRAGERRRRRSGAIAGAGARPVIGTRQVVRYFTGIIRCWYGVPGHITYGRLGSSAFFGYASAIGPGFRTMTWAPVSTHFFPAGGFVAYGSSLFASEPPISMYPNPTP